MLGFLPIEFIWNIDGYTGSTLDMYELESINSCPMVPIGYYIREYTNELHMYTTGLPVYAKSFLWHML